MPVYTVHQPPPRKDKTSIDPERVVFVRDGFHVWAFLLGPFWMLWRRLWLVVLLYLAVTALMQIGLALIGAGGVAQISAGALISLLVGLEAASLRRWTLARRGFKMLGVVVGEDIDVAERRFFSAAIAQAEPKSPSPPRSLPTAWMPRASTQDVIGFFPEPGGQR